MNFNLFTEFSFWHAAIVVILFYICIVIGFQASKTTVTETFDDNGSGNGGLLTQSLTHFAKTLVKQEPSNIYDSFYSKIYDVLFHNAIKDEFELYNIVQYVTKEAKPVSHRFPSLHKIAVLDLGCGVGHHLSIMSKQGAVVTGVDISRPMLERARDKVPGARLVHGDFMHGAVLPSGMYNIILCLFFTVYYASDVDVFFGNCSNWLKPNGYFCVHLVHSKKFDPVLEKSSKLIPLYDPQKYRDSRQTHTQLSFNKFLYTADWTFGASEHDKSSVEFREEFKYKDGSMHRIHTHTLYMHPLKYYVTKANSHGFKLEKVIDLLPAGHDHSYVYVFRKT
jgi:2-polyprenyl-3-methyl-5-hydroxy-6-metoxy-1,4-benzoquinol methylase